MKTEEKSLTNKEIDKDEIEEDEIEELEYFLKQKKAQTKVLKKLFTKLNTEENQ